MSIDRYTKACLTVIAASLMLIAARGFSPAPSALAESQVQRIAVCDVNGQCADVDAYGALLIKQTD